MFDVMIDQPPADENDLAALRMERVDDLRFDRMFAGIVSYN